ncbi:unnamed protein product [Ambrosiozyma monospora]|uniref:Unnamed protein product n=1 Tax=Ambrosiozyma monospora TaxID=43982 RepID=A0ACB5U638_AMBMO|nr:unnamed protein product [Ambrosiozyma monospora]
MNTGNDALHDVDLSSSSHARTQSTSSRRSTRLKKTYEGGIFSLNYYRQFFDLDTNEFFSNCYKSLNPFVRLDFDEFSEVGDLYGSIWITATLIFLLFFCNSFAELIGELVSRHEGTSEIDYFKMIITSINLLYGYIILTPSLLWVILKFYFKISNLSPISKLISIYSYSNLLWIPAAFLSVFRGLLVNHHTVDTILKWGCIGIGAILSGVSLSVKLNQYFNYVFGEEEKKVHMILLGILLLVHFGFSIGVKVCFFGDFI